MVMMHELSPAPGSKKRRTRVGRGIGSGKGIRATRGQKGQKSRTGGTKGAGFEGGQMPLYRRLPKMKGFKPPVQIKYAIVNLSQLNAFAPGADVTPDVLLKEKVIKDINSGVKILGGGDIKVKLKISAHQFSASALEKLKSAGCDAVQLETGSREQGAGRNE